MPNKNLVVTSLLTKVPTHNASGSPWPTGTFSFSATPPALPPAMSPRMLPEVYFDCIDNWVLQQTFVYSNHNLNQF